MPPRPRGARPARAGVPELLLRLPALEPSDPGAADELARLREWMEQQNPKPGSMEHATALVSELATPGARGATLLPWLARVLRQHGARLIGVLRGPEAFNRRLVLSRGCNAACELLEACCPTPPSAGEPYPPVAAGLTEHVLASGILPALAGAMEAWAATMEGWATLSEQELVHALGVPIVQALLLWRALSRCACTTHAGTAALLQTARPAAALLLAMLRLLPPAPERAMLGVRSDFNDRYSIALEVTVSLGSCAGGPWTSRGGSLEHRPSAAELQLLAAHVACLALAGSRHAGGSASAVAQREEPPRRVLHALGLGRLATYDARHLVHASGWPAHMSGACSNLAYLCQCALRLECEAVWGTTVAAALEPLLHTLLEAAALCPQQALLAMALHAASVVHGTCTQLLDAGGPDAAALAAFTAQCLSRLGPAVLRAARAAPEDWAADDATCVIWLPERSQATAGTEPSREQQQAALAETLFKELGKMLVLCAACSPDAMADAVRAYVSSRRREACAVLESVLRSCGACDATSPSKGEQLGAALLGVAAAAVLGLESSLGCEAQQAAATQRAQLWLAVSGLKLAALAVNSGTCHQPAGQLAMCVLRWAAGMGAAAAAAAQAAPQAGAATASTSGGGGTAPLEVGVWQALAGRSAHVFGSLLASLQQELLPAEQLSEVVRVWLPATLFKDVLPGLQQLEQLWSQQAAAAPSGARVADQLSEQLAQLLRAVHACSRPAAEPRAAGLAAAGQLQSFGAALWAAWPVRGLCCGSVACTALDTPSERILVGPAARAAGGGRCQCGATFCCKNCQLAAWPSHKAACKRATGAPAPPPAARSTPPPAERRPAPSGSSATTGQQASSSAGASSALALSAAELRALPVRALKAHLACLGADASGATEKEELVQLALRHSSSSGSEA